jgi:hypothetical protein
MNLFRKFNPNQLFVDGLLGQYSLGVSTTLVNSSVVGEIYQFRWTDPVRICGIQRVAIQAVVSASTVILDVVQIDVIKATGWTGQGTGVVAIDMSGGTNKRRSGMDTSKIAAGDIRYSGTPLGAGTKTLEANSLASILATGSAQPNLPYTRVIEAKPGDTEYPVVLQTNEGFVVKIIQNTVAANGLQVSINVDWIETNPT